MIEQRVPLGRVITFRDERAGNGGDLPLLSVSIHSGVQPKSDQGRADDLGNYKICREGDIALNRMRAFQGALGLALVDGIVSPDYTVIRTLGGMDSRYLAYLMRSDWFIGRMTSRIRGIGGTDSGMVRTPRINNEDLAAIRVPLPSLDVQRRIADFLDDQVAIMDRVGLLRDTQLALVADAFDSSGDKALTGLALDGPPLSAVATIVDTEHKTAPTVPGGQRWIAGTSAIREGTLRWEHLRETDREHFAEWTRRAAPRAGDVLLTREAPVGEVALLRSDDPQVAIGQRVVLLRPSGGVEGGFLRAVLMSSILHRVVNLTTQGSLHPHLNMSDIARIRIPVASLSKQHEVAQKHAELLERFSALRDCLTSARELMEARKRSLITAAVTGVFDVTSASSRPAEVVLAGTGGAV